jgi:beta-glucosidase
MNSYNLVNSEYTGESRWLLNDVLRDEWGFEGFVMPDWTSLWNTERAIVAGVDIEMPGGKQTYTFGLY